MKLSLGPVLYYWPRDTLLDFYDKVSGWPVDIVYLGETVCSKRRAFSITEWMEIGERLTATGKEVVLSTLSLLEAESELKTLRRVCENGRFLVEANDMAAINLLAGKVPFITGPTVNLYNHRSLCLLHGMGLKRWVLPVELSRAALADLQAKRPQGLEVEVYAYGRLPLSISARCFTARAHNLSKDDCQYRCLDHPEGMMLYSQEDQPFLTLNGVQTMSALIHNLIGELPDMMALQVDVARVSPGAHRTEQIISIFREVLDGRRPATVAAQDLCPSPGTCTGYWFGGPGIAHHVPPMSDI
ncbi:Ubiquinone biosynthesis protein UbiV [Gammaproteobacteria bacterium]